MKKAKSIAKNYIYNVSYQVLTVLAPLITAPYVSRVLGPENVGTYSYTASIVTYFITLAILGTEAYARREIAYRQNDKCEYSTLFVEMIIFRAITTILSLSIFLGIIWNEEGRILYLIQAINIIAVAIDVTWFFQGLEEFGKIVLRNFLIRIINIAAIFIFVKSQSDLTIYIFLLAFLPLLGHISMWLYLPKYITKVSLKKIKLKKHIGGILGLFVPTIAVAIYGALDKTMIGLFTETNLQNGYYEQADKIVKLLLTVVNSLSVVMAPRIAGTIAEANNEKVKEYMSKSYQYVGFLALPICFGLLALARRFIPWYFGSEYYGAVSVLQVLSFLVPIVGFSSLTGVQYLIAVKRENIFTLALFVGAFVNFFCNLYLIPRYYAVGAAFATILGEMAILFVEIGYIILFEKRLSVRDVFGGFWRYIVASILMYIIVALGDSYLSNNVLSLIILVVCGAIIYCGILTILKDTFIGYIFRKLKMMVFRKG